MFHPIVMWVISIVARLGFQYLPLDMWRMPVNVRKGMVAWLAALAALPPGGQDRPGGVGLEGRTARAGAAVTARSPAQWAGIGFGS